MKSIIEHITEAIVDEGRTAFSDIKTDWSEDDMEIYAQEAIDSCYKLASSLEGTKPADLKKVRDFKKYDMSKLEDYCKIIEEIGAWINGVIAIAEDDMPAAATYIEMVQFMADDNDSCIENVADNVTDLKSVQDGEDVYDYLKDIFAHWNDVSKVVIGKPWN